MNGTENIEQSRLADHDRSEVITWVRILAAAAFFTCAFLFIWLQVDTQLLYHGDTVLLAPER